jgi:hypothetical protein
MEEEEWLKSKCFNGRDILRSFISLSSSMDSLVDSDTIDVNVCVLRHETFEEWYLKHSAIPIEIISLGELQKPSLK